MPDYEEQDYCDLDPTKLCDNCCRCIESNRDYEEFDIELTHRIEDIQDMLEADDMLLLNDDEIWDNDPGQSGGVSPIDIDPMLAAEWERRLKEEGL